MSTAKTKILQISGLKSVPKEKKATLSAFFLRPATQKNQCQRSIKIENMYSLSSWLSWIGCVPQFQFDTESYKNSIAVEKKDYDKLKSDYEAYERNRLSQGWLDDKKPKFDSQEEIIFVEKVVVPPEDKILIIGDIHSSLSSLLSIFDNWRERGWLSDDFQLAKGFHLFFLGDVIDRGALSTELIVLIFLLTRANQNNVTYINGNHENCFTYKMFGMEDEIANKFGITDTSEMLDYMSFLSFQPTMVIVKFGKQIFQLCHGAFTDNLSEQEKIAQLIQSNDRFAFLRVYSKMCMPITGKIDDFIKWGDFAGVIENRIGSVRGKYMKVFGWNTTQHYLKSLGITAIISGHQDLSNFTMLLTPLCSKQGKEIDVNYKTLYRPLEYGLKTFQEQVSFTPGEDFIAVNTSTAIDAKENIGLLYNCFLLLFFGNE